MVFRGIESRGMMMDFKFKWVCAGFAYLVVNLMLDGANFCNGARTGDFLRKKDPSLDMPLDSDVFTIPSGYNAPQQVTPPLNFFIILLSPNPPLFASQQHRGKIL